jgi:valyl-tRNA synthetase
MTDNNKTPPAKTLDSTAQQEKWGAYWQEQGIYHWDANAPREESYVIDTPPPTVSGNLHIGHVYSYTQTDLMARFQRMRGKNVYYPIGYDDNGLPTERLVEKERNIRASDMSREDFIKICEDVVIESEKVFRGLFQTLGMSYDWRTEYMTISPHARKISQMSALDLYQKDHLYRSLQPSLWDPVDRTAIAQAEIVEKEQNGVMYHFPFTLENGEEIMIGSTRPELLAACVALMCHPDHPRAKDLIGKKAYTALFNVEVPIVADERVSLEKGTGFVMCCTFGDLTDIEWWKEHQLPLRVIVGQDGLLRDMETIGDAHWPSRTAEQAKAIAAELNGMHVRKAKTKMVELLKEHNLIRDEQNIVQVIPCAERSGAPLEIIVTAQWVIKLLDKKDLLLQKGREMQWHPDYMRLRYEDWVTNLKWDWTISRQRYFGIPLPFWYSKRKGEEGKIIAASMDELPVNPLVTPPRGYTMDEVEPEKDVMDTWATSSNSPQIQSHGISGDFMLDAERHAKLFPADLRPQGHDIIRTWAFYTTAKAALHENSVPFKNLAISGWCLAEDKSKMSKSKGNTVTPQQILQNHSVEAIRYWSSNFKLGRDTVYSEDGFKVGKRTLTKLWNASRLVALHVTDFTPQYDTAANAIAHGVIHAPFDRWIIGQLHKTIEIATREFNDYDYTAALEAIEKFFWKDYCDNYLELAKGRLYGDRGTESDNQSAKHALYYVHKGLLSLFAPFFPYITEELFSDLYPTEFAAQKSIHARGFWPDIQAYPYSDTIATQANGALDIVSAVRKMKSANNLSMRVPITMLHVSSTPDQKNAWEQIEACWPDVQHTVNAESVTWHNSPLANDNSFDGDHGLFRLQAEVQQA